MSKVRARSGWSLGAALLLGLALAAPAWGQTPLVPYHAVNPLNGNPAAGALLVPVNTSGTVNLFVGKECR